MISFLKDLDERAYVLELPTDPHHERGSIAIETETFFKIDEYAWSTPTAPSPGRIYRRSYKAEHDPERLNHYVFVVADEPGTDGKTQIHIPCEVMFT